MDDDQDFEKGHEIYKALSTEINHIGNKKFLEGFVDGLRRDHRTLQQGFGRLILQIIAAKSEDFKENNYDLRNEAFCQFCHAVMKYVPEENRLFPFI